MKYHKMILVCSNLKPIVSVSVPAGVAQVAEHLSRKQEIGVSTTSTSSNNGVTCATS